MKKIHISIITLFFLLVLTDNCFGQYGEENGRKFYKVQKGDISLFAISQKAGIEIELVKKFNPQIENFDVIHRGDKIYLSPPLDDKLSDDPIVMDEPVFQKPKIAKEFRSFPLGKVYKYNRNRYFVFSFNTKNHEVRVFNEITEEERRRLGNIRSPIHDFRTIDRLTRDQLLFAMNGGMFEQGGAPVGLLVSDGEILNPLNVETEGFGNFYDLPPNGVFGILKNGTPFLQTTADLKHDFLQNEKAAAERMSIATQSGPMMLIDGKMNRAFNKGSKNLNYRNGVGITDDGEIFFIISIDRVNFYDFSQLFRSFKCDNALYLDGFVSSYYIPTLMRERNGKPKIPEPRRPLGTFLAVTKRR